MRKQLIASTPQGSRPPYFDRLLPLVTRKGRTREDAEEIVQEALLRLHVYARKAPVANEEAFLRHAVRNLIIDRYRHERLSRQFTIFLEDLEIHTELISPHPGPEDILQIRQRLDAIGAVLDAASSRTREIYMAIRAGYTHSEIANHLNISPVTVRRHMARALAILAERDRSGTQ
jgi:RNA polymerase sigma factor (sigma-70 family)